MARRRVLNEKRTGAEGEGDRWFRKRGLPCVPQRETQGRKGHKGPQTWPAAAFPSSMFAGRNSLMKLDFPDCNSLPSPTM